MALITNPFTTIAKVQRFMSASFAIGASDHDDDGQPDTDVLEDAVNWSSEEIYLYCHQRYSRADLAGSEWVARWSTILASNFASITRGNPPPDAWQKWIDRLYEVLEQIKDGTALIPDLATKYDMRPTISNLTVDRRYRRSKIRVTKANSTDAPSKLSQDFANDFPGVWN